MTMVDTTPLAAALAYAARGWRVVPIRPGEKRPPMSEWQRAATTDAALIREWYQHWPNHGVGIATGAQSGLWALDVDISDDKRGDDTLADLEATYGALPATVEVVTGSGGRHLYWRWPDGIVITNDAGRRLGPGLDVRGEGGQILAPPTVHPNGSRYSWEVSGDPDDIAVADAPAWLLELLTAAPTTPPRVERPPSTGDQPGDRFAASPAAEWHKMLTGDGATFLGARVDHRTGTGYELWARPGVDHASATLYYGGTDLLKVFSSNWGGPGWSLNEGETYTRFGYWTARHYGGDFARAAADLAGQQDAAALDAWISAVNTAAATAPIEAAPDERPATLRIRWVDSLEAGLPPEPAELVGGLLRKRELCVFGAPRALGKTWLGFNLATLLAEGEGDFLGSLPVLRPARTLYLQGELDEWGSATRWMLLTGLGRPLPAVAETFDRLKLRVVKVRRSAIRDGVPVSEEYFEGIVDPRLEATVIAEGIDVIVVDPWAVYYAGSENSNDEVEAALATLRDLAFRHDVAVVILHHIGKNSDVREPEDLWRGASRLADWASTRVTILPHYSEAQRKELGLERREARRYADVYFLRRSTPTDDFSMELVDGWWQPWTDDRAGIRTGRPPAVSALDLVSALSTSGGEWASYRVAAEVLQVSRDAAEYAIVRAAEAGFVATRPGPNRATITSLRPLDEEAEDDNSQAHIGGGKVSGGTSGGKPFTATTPTPSDLPKQAENVWRESPVAGKSLPPHETAGQTAFSGGGKVPPPTGVSPLEAATPPVGGSDADREPDPAASPLEPIPTPESWLWIEPNGSQP